MLDLALNGKPTPIGVWAKKMKEMQNEKVCGIFSNNAFLPPGPGPPIPPHPLGPGLSDAMSKCPIAAAGSGLLVVCL
jgi:hypothetical protein